MCQYIETLRVVDGCVCNLAYHEQRMNRTRKEMLGQPEPLHIADLLKAVSLPMECSKLRFVYDKEGIHDITCTPYTCREIRSLHLVYADNISYPYKSTDRSALNELKKSYTNIALYDGEQWFTPSTPLLCGTMRQRLLDCGLLQEREISVSDIPNYQYISLFNAMISLGEIILPIDRIR